MATARQLPPIHTLCQLWTSRITCKAPSTTSRRKRKLHCAGTNNMAGPTCTRGAREKSLSAAQMITSAADRKDTGNDRSNSQVVTTVVGNPTCDMPSAWSTEIRQSRVPLFGLRGSSSTTALAASRVGTYNPIKSTAASTVPTNSPVLATGGPCEFSTPLSHKVQLPCPPAPRKRTRPSDIDVHGPAHRLSSAKMRLNFDTAQNYRWLTQR